VPFPHPSVLAARARLAGPRLVTADGERLAYEVLPGPGGVCVVLAHGFSGSLAGSAVRRVAEALAGHATVLAYDARGHGRSTGLTTLGDREALDVDAAVAEARTLAPKVVTCGFSMGRAAVVRQAALRGRALHGHRLRHAPDAVAAVSTTADWTTRRSASPPMRRLHRIVESAPGRGLARCAMGTRIDPAGWRALPASPRELAAGLAPLPLLVVHGDRDAHFPTSVARNLAAAARPAAELWIEPGFGHAENGAGAGLLDRLGRRLAQLGAAPQQACA